MPRAIDINDDAVVQRFADAAAALCQQGLEFARRDDPHGFATASQLVASGQAKLQLRVDFTDYSTTAYAINPEGEPIAQIFRIIGAAARRTEAALKQ